jgi:hypothetical protein
LISQAINLYSLARIVEWPKVCTDVSTVAFAVLTVWGAGIATVHDKIRLHFRQTVPTQKRLRDVAPMVAQPQLVTETRSAGRVHNGDNGQPHAESSSQPVATGSPPVQSDATGANNTLISNIVNPQDYNNSNDHLNPTMQDMYNNNPSYTTGWKPVSPEQSFIQSGLGDNTSDSLVISQGVFGGLDPDRLPFANYNTEELWNWMFFMDTDESMQVIFQGGV